MGLFNIFKKKSQAKQLTEKISYGFTNEQLTVFVDKAITAFYENRDNKSNDVMTAIDAFTHNKVCSTALYRFLPIVLCHKLFPEVTYTDYYTIFKSKNDYTEHLFVNNQMYNVINGMVIELLNNRLSRDEMYAILAHSSEMSAMNEALHNGSRLEDLEMSPVCFLDLED